MSTLENQPKPGSTPVNQKKRSKVIDVFLVLVLVVSLGFFAYSLTQPDVLEVPEVVPQSVEPESVVQDSIEIPGSNTGQDEMAGEEVPLNTEPNSEGDVAEVISIPAFGDEESGQEGVLTNEETTRPTDGQIITNDLKRVCPGLANGSICFPDKKQVIYYHNVGTYWHKGTERMSVPSTFSAGWYRDSAPVGSNEGTSLFAAHVVYNGGKKGPFFDLPRMKTGQDIIIRDMKGRNYVYRVYNTQKVDRDALPDELYETEGQAQIALVTCTGTLVSGRHQERAIIWAVPVTP